MMHWETLSLSDVILDAKPGFACGEDPPEGIFQFRMNNVTTEGLLDLSKKRRVPKDTSNLEAYLLKPGDVLFNATNSPELVGKTAFFPGNGEPAVFSNHFLRLRPHPDKMEGRFLARWLIFLFQRRAFQNMCRQWVNQSTVGRNDLLALRVPVPPRSEQRRIAEVLDRAEALRAKRRTALVQLDNLNQSIFLDMFGDSHDFKTSALAELCELITDGTHYTPEYSGDGVLFLSARNVVSGYVDWERVKFIPESLHRELQRRVAPRVNDVLLAKNGTTGIAAIVDRDCVFDIYVSLALLRAKNGLLPVYLHTALNSPMCAKQFRDALKGIGVPNLHLNEIRKTRIPDPPISLQHQFVCRRAAVEKLKTAQRGSLAQLDALFSALQDRAFRGEL